MLKKLWAWITGAANKIKQILNFGKNMANNIKAIADSNLLDIIVALTPTDIDNIALEAWRIYMIALIKKMNWADKILSQADEEEKIIILHTLSACSAYWKSQQDNAGLNLQTTMSIPQLIYNTANVDIKAV